MKKLIKIQLFCCAILLNGFFSITQDNCSTDYCLKNYYGFSSERNHDGLWDKYDKCPDFRGGKANKGCPVEKPLIDVKLDGHKFVISGVDIRNEYKAVLITKGSFKTKEFQFTSNKCPSNTFESKWMLNQSDVDNLTIIISVIDKKGIHVSEKTFYGYSFRCFVNGDCGFVKE
jgi:hypothetical protein